MTDPALRTATAAFILGELRSLAEEAEFEKVAKRVGAEQTIGVRMKSVFDLAKVHTGLPLDEVERLLESNHYEARMVAVSILDFKARQRRISDEERRELYDLYLRRHDRIDTWDLVDRAAPRVLGGYLLDHARDVLDELSASPDVWRRRSAITATFLLIRNGELDDALRIADRLMDDEHLIQTSVGIALREVGKIDPGRRDAFLADRAHRVSPVTRRMARD